MKKSKVKKIFHLIAFLPITGIFLLAGCPALLPIPTPLPSPRTPDSGDLFGTWNISYDWDCNDDLLSFIVFINTDGTYTDNQDGTGTWELNGSVITLTYTGNVTLLTGAVNSECTKITGIMDSNSSEKTGCWDAIKTGTPGPHDISGTWVFDCDWGCDGGTEYLIFYIYEDGTFSHDGQNITGNWELTENTVTLSNTIAGIVYTGTMNAEATSMSGNMVNNKTQATGCWVSF